MEKINRQNLDVQQLADRLRQELPRLRRDYSVRSLGLFGSCVRGEQRRSSDLDVLVEFTVVPGMLRFLDLERDLSQLVGMPVDLVQKDALKPAIGQRIAKEILPI
ncbi:MAG: nucleotidyltransferase family protein [Trichloromonadaceae bacterium]